MDSVPAKPVFKPTATLSDMTLRAFLNNPQLIKEFPEFKDASDRLISTVSSPIAGKGCTPCAKRSKESHAIWAARAVLMSLPPERAEAWKKSMNITGQIRVISRPNNKIEIKVI